LARRAFLENFDAEVHERLRAHKDTAKVALDQQQRMLLDLAKFGLDGRATFDESEPCFQVKAEGAADAQRFHLEWQRAEVLGDTFFRLDHPLAQELIDKTAKAFLLELAHGHPERSANGLAQQLVLSV